MACDELRMMLIHLFSDSISGISQSLKVHGLVQACFLAYGQEQLLEFPWLTASTVFPAISNEQ